MMQVQSVLCPAVVPPAKEERKVMTRSGKTIDVRILTKKLPGSPNYEYQAYYLDHLILHLISNPSDGDLLSAYEKHMRTKGGKA